MKNSVLLKTTFYKMLTFLFFLFLLSCKDKVAKTPDSGPTPVEVNDTLIPEGDTMVETADEEEGKKGAQKRNSIGASKSPAMPAATIDHSKNQKGTEIERPVKPPLKEKIPESLPLPVEGQKSDPPLNEIVEKFNLHDHQIWNDLLQKYVSRSGLVDYNGFRNDPKFKQYLDLLAENSPQKSWSRNQSLAFWINAYNAFTIRRITEKNPSKSILDLDGGKTWDVKWIKIGDASYSLNEIENTIIRPQFKDPRIHFALNCGALSCPPLFNKAFTDNNLVVELENRTKAFINDNHFTEITGNSAKLSKIFEWYAADFGDLTSFIKKYRPIEKNAKISYLEYDWSLNKQ